MAINMGTNVIFRPDGGEVLDFTSANDHQRTQIKLLQFAVNKHDYMHYILPKLKPVWARYMMAILYMITESSSHETRSSGGQLKRDKLLKQDELFGNGISGGNGYVFSSLPIGAGLSSSAALEIALALAFGYQGEPLKLAELCREAEYKATGVMCGLMDQLITVSAVENHALLVNFSSLETKLVLIPEDVEVIVAHSGKDRQLSASGYALRQQECATATKLVGPLSNLGIKDLPSVKKNIKDSTIYKRAKHIITENDRVLNFVDTLGRNDFRNVGEIMNKSHLSLIKDFEVSTPEVNELVDILRGLPGVYGVRMTGGGFGGCVVALAKQGAVNLGDIPVRSWKVTASGKAYSTTNNS